MALSVLELDSDIVKFFAENLLATKTKIRKCSICNNLSETEICEICGENLMLILNQDCIAIKEKVFY